MKMPKGFWYSEELHRYGIGKDVVPGVTGVLTDLGFIDTTWFKPEHAERGTLVHDLTQLVDTGRMVATGYDHLHGYIRSWLGWKELLQIRINRQHIEERLFNAAWRYCGRCDRARVPFRGGSAIVDLKTGAHSDWHKLQINAYNACFKKPHDIGLLVYLNPKGKPAKMREVQLDGRDAIDWCHAIATYNRKHGL